MAFGNGPRIVTNGLILSLDAGDRNSYVSGSNTWFDLSGNGYNFIGTGSYGFSNNAIVFNRNNVSNTGTIFTLSNIANQLKVQNFLANSFTIEVWMAPQTLTPSNTDATENLQALVVWPGLHNHMSFNTGSIYSIEIWNSSLTGTFNFFTTSSQALPTTSSYNQITTVINRATTASIAYNNGIQTNITSSVPSSTMTSANGNPADTLSIGAARTTLTYRWFYTGSIAIVKLYNRALSAAEVQQNYNAQKSRFNL